jgi:hypothetical protein
MLLTDYNFNESDVITTDKYLEYCKNNNITYYKVDFLFKNGIWRGQKINAYNKNSEILVLGHGDLEFSNDIFNKINNDKLKKVFSLNTSCINNKVFYLPLGITNDCDDSPIHKIYGNTRIMLEAFNYKPEYLKLAYMNFNINTYKVERQKVYNKFSNEKFITIGGQENSMNGRLKYLREIREHKFVLCPRGNGIDTHRMWETLYMGRIPIVIYEPMYKVLEDLPILFIKSWDEINETFLETKYNEFIKKEWNYDKVKINYWLKKI